jgi:sugar lactone lactonase YvrE
MTEASGAKFNKMKKTYYLFFVLALTIATTGARAQFPNFPAADRVLGASDFTTPGNAAATPSGFSFPSGVAIDPLTGKLFVASAGQNRVLRFASAASLANGTNAESVFGQTTFSGTSPGTSATNLAAPSGLHVDRKGRLWVADFDNNRVLMFQGASTLPGFGSAPDRVFGQPDFTTSSSGTTASKMNGPFQVFVDASDNLWVSDADNNRVLKFANVSALGNGAAASAVIGQPNFTTGSAATSSVKMDRPFGVTIDAGGRLWVAEFDNNRILRFDNAAALANGAAANAVLGQPNFTSSSSGTTAQTLSSPGVLITDAAGALYVSDYGNGRVLIYKNAAAKANGAAADIVIGQPDMTTNTVGITDRILSTPFGGLAFDAAGSLWISSYASYRVLRFSPDRLAATPATSGKVPKSTSSSKVTLKGTATDPSGVASVRFRVGKGAFKNAAGTTSWKLTAKLKPGKNTIEIVMVDAVGNVSAAKRVKVTRG